jgi:hypothetical protein
MRKTKVTMSVNVAVLVLIAACASQVAHAATMNSKEAVYITFDTAGCATAAIKLEDHCPNPQGKGTICRSNSASSQAPNKVQWIALPKRRGADNSQPENQFTLLFAEPVCSKDDELKSEPNDKQRCTVVSPDDPPPEGTTVKYDVHSIVAACTDLDPFIIVRN